MSNSCVLLQACRRVCLLGQIPDGQVEACMESLAIPHSLATQKERQLILKELLDAVLVRLEGHVCDCKPTLKLLSSFIMTSLTEPGAHQHQAAD